MREKEVSDFQPSGFDSPFWTLARQDAQVVGEEGNDLVLTEPCEF